MEVPPDEKSTNGNEADEAPPIIVESPKEEPTSSVPEDEPFSFLPDVEMKTDEEENGAPIKDEIEAASKDHIPSQVAEACSYAIQPSKVPPITLETVKTYRLKNPIVADADSESSEPENYNDWLERIKRTKKTTPSKAKNKRRARMSATKLLTAVRKSPRLALIGKSFPAFSTGDKFSEANTTASKLENVTGKPCSVIKIAEKEKHTKAANEAEPSTSIKNIEDALEKQELVETEKNNTSDERDSSPDPYRFVIDEDPPKGTKKGKKRSIDIGSYLYQKKLYVMQQKKNK